MNNLRLKTLSVWLSVCVLSACGDGGSTGTTVRGTDGSTSSTETVVFEVSDFSEVAVAGPFNVSLLQGSEFSVEITIDRDDVDALNINKSGQTLNIGFQSGTNVQVGTLEAVVVLPTLTRVILAGATNAMFSGFAGSALDVELVGAAVLEGLNVRYDFVMVSAIGASQLFMEDVAAIAAVHAEFLGASSATINLMDSATLTGSLTAASALFYYGSNVRADIDTDLTSTVQRLGDTRSN